MTPSPLSNGETADARMTAEREETKYLVPPARWETLAAELSHRLSGHRFTGEGANRLPDPHHYVTTIYFDTPSRALFRAAATAPDDNLKVRAKEYYDLHPSLAEIATDPAQIVRYQPWLWFELKRREGSRTSKRRFRLPKRDVAQFFAEGRVTSEALDLAEASEGESLRDVIRICGTFGEPLAAVCVVNYRRHSWQSDEGDLRVTFDRGLASFAPPGQSVGAPPRAGAQRPGGAGGAGDERRARGQTPGRGARLAHGVLGRIGAAPVPFSKFVTAARAVEAHA